MFTQTFQVNLNNNNKKNMFLRLILFMNFIYLFISNFFCQFHSTFKPFADLMLTQQHLPLPNLCLKQISNPPAVNGNCKLT